MEPDSRMYDAVDRRILARLQRDSTIQNQQLAAEVGLSPSPCHRRVRALEQAGVIRGYVALLDASTVGAGFLAYVDVRLDRQSVEYSERFEKARKCVLKLIPASSAKRTTTSSISRLSKWPRLASLVEKPPRPMIEKACIIASHADMPA